MSNQSDSQPRSYGLLSLIFIAYIAVWFVRGMLNAISGAITAIMDARQARRA